MPDISAIAGLLTSIKTSTDLAKLTLGLRDAQLVRDKVSELMGQLVAAHDHALSARAAQAELIGENDKLKQQAEKLKSWRREAKRYQLTEIATGVFAYALRPGHEAGEPPHNICATCYQEGRKSILQGFSRSSGSGRASLLRCDSCKAEIIIGFKPITYPPIRSRTPGSIA